MLEDYNHILASLNEEYDKEVARYDDDFEGLVEGFRYYLEIEALTLLEDVYDLAELWKHEF